jgi:four helix bundle protein
MAMIEKFEDIVAWQEARMLTQNIYTATRREPFARDFGLRDQIQRASVSSMSNMAEGFDCDSKVEFGRFLGIARSSAVEVHSLLYVAMDVDYLTSKEFKDLYEQARKAKALVGGFKRSLTPRA